VVSVPLWFWYNPANPEFQFVERIPWIPSVGADYFLGVDGLAVLLILLTTMMGTIATLSSWTAIEERVKEYYIFLLVLQTGMLGAFMSLDFLLFFLFWEVMLVPMYFLIGIWGSSNRLYSAIKFFLYTLVGSVVMLLGILALYFYNHSVTGVYTFDVTQFHRLNVPFNLQWWVFLAFFLGFAIKVPMFPFHTWLPDAHTDAPTAGSVILAGRPAEDGHLRIPALQPADSAGSIPPFRPDDGAAVNHRHRLRRSRRAGAEGLEAAGRILVGQPYGDGDARHVRAESGGHHRQHRAAAEPRHLDRRALPAGRRRLRTPHTREISEYGGLSKVMPVYAAVFLIMTMSSIGLPALNGFIGEVLILQGVFVASKVWAAFAASGVVLGAAYMLYLYQRTMFGKIENPKNESLLDLSQREFATFAPLLILAFWIGIYPAAIDTTAGNIGASHRVAGQSAVRGEVRRQLRSDADAGAGGGDAGDEPGSEIPERGSVRRQWQPVASEPLRTRRTPRTSRTP
jgi:NADH-quinone oxidoreductase subunit M